MSRKALALAVLIVSAGLASCALMQKLRSGDIAGVVSDVSRADEMRRRCEELNARPIVLKEEVAFGGAMAVGLSQRANGLFIEVDGGAEGLRDPAKVRLADVPKNQLNRYLNLVGKNLAAQSARPTLEWTFGVIDSDAVNAFSTPGGYVLVTRGLLRKIDNEAQLAGVLGHEIAHVTERHALNAYRRIKALECSAAVGGAGAEMLVGRETVASVKQGAALAASAAASFNSMVAPGNSDGSVDFDAQGNHDALAYLTDKVIDFIASHGFDQNDETDADRIGMELAMGAGYQPREYIAFLGKLPDSKETFPNHPARELRQKALNDRLDGLDDPLLPDPNAKYVIKPLKAELAAAR